MASMIDPSKPTVGHATTDSVRKNFQFAKQDIEYMQNQVAALVDRVNALEQEVEELKSTGGSFDVAEADARYLQLTGGIMQGEIHSDIEPTTATSLVNKKYMDAHSPTVMDFTYNTNIVDPPANGQIRFNNADQQVVTEVRVSKVTAPGASVDIFLKLIDGGSKTMAIQDKDDDTKQQVYTITGFVADHIDYVTIPVTWKEGRASLTAQRVLLIF